MHHAQPSVDQAETSPAPVGSDVRPRRRWWRRHRARIAIVAVGLILLLITFGMRDPSPVGHWDSAEGQSRFMAAYQAALEEMPEVAETIDVRTDFGVVRVYRFDGQVEG